MASLYWGASADDAKESAAMGIVSDPIEAGGLPVPDIESTELAFDGESGYA